MDMVSLAKGETAMSYEISVDATPIGYVEGVL